MPTNLTSTEPGPSGTFSRALPFATGVKLMTSKNAETAVNAINAVILMRRMVDLLLGCYPGLGEKTLTKKFSAKESVQFISRRGHGFILFACRKTIFIRQMT
jgi:hypothetical protein